MHQNISTLPRSIFLMPGRSHPIQSIMYQNLGYTHPVCVSLVQPQKDRDIRRVLVWATGSIYSETERSALEYVFHKAGIEYIIQDESKMTSDDFENIYHDASFDLLWLATHGEYNHYEPHTSKILLFDDGKKQNFITLEKILTLTVPQNNRRLLVLNLCDGATTASLGGITEIGIAAMLASANQAIISHLWPIDTIVGLVYGTLLAAELVDADTFFSAYQNTLGKLRREFSEIYRDLLSRYEGTCLCERLKNQGHIYDPTSLLHTCSSVFLE